jgi:hypothetical protein
MCGVGFALDKFSQLLGGYGAVIKMWTVGGLTIG